MNTIGSFVTIQIFIEFCLDRCIQNFHWTLNINQIIDHFALQSASKDLMLREVTHNSGVIVLVIFVVFFVVFL